MFTLGFEEDQAGFYGMIENIDENMGLLFNKLQEWQLLDSTLIIFMSDNGMARVSRSAAGKPLGTQLDGTPMDHYNAGMKGHKVSADEGGVRVPFFVRWDNHISPGRTIDTIAAHIDILPTLGALAGACMPEGQVEGRSLLPLIEEQEIAWPDRFLFTHRGRWPTGTDPEEFKLRNYAVRNQRFRWVDGNQLYDMQQDPGQTANVIDQHPQVVEQMRAAYDQWWQGTKPLMINENAPMSPTRPYHVLYQQQVQSTGIPTWDAPQL